MPGYVIYENRLIVAILTQGSKNPKTGNMDQVWILPKAFSPLKTYRSGKDTIVCGFCKRTSKESGGDGSCYVQLIHGPEQIWNAYTRNKYPVCKNLTELGRNRHIRLGAYGEPAFIPIQILDELLKHAASWTGYTHQWPMTFYDTHKKYCMASVDDLEETERAQRRGWRTFRVSKSFIRNKREAVCPGSKEAGFKLQCINCPPKLKCSGGPLGEAHNIVIKEH